MSDRASDRAIGYVVTGVVLLGAMLFGTIYFYNRQFVQGGYCETTVPGHSSMAWVKCGGGK